MLASRFLLTLSKELGQEDRIQHMAWSFWLLLGAAMLWPLPVAVLTVFFTGICKEIWDKYYGSGFCFYDLTGNCIGMLLALLFGIY